MTKEQLIKDNKKLKELLKKQQGALVLSPTTITDKKIMINGHFIQFADLTFQDCEIHMASELLSSVMQGDTNVTINGGKVTWPPHLWKVPCKSAKINKVELIKGELANTDIEYLNN